jgi:hypothetical protein
MKYMYVCALLLIEYKKTRLYAVIVINLYTNGVFSWKHRHTYVVITIAVVLGQQRERMQENDFHLREIFKGKKNPSGFQQLR